jgi:hypothetical protein
MVIYGKKPSKIQDKKHCHHFAYKNGCNRTCGFPPTTSTAYIYGCFFATGRFEDLTFCKPDVLKNLTFCKPDVSDVLNPNIVKPDVLWVYLAGAPLGLY